jgi:hypothetical protein
MHMYANVVSTIGSWFVTSIFRWISGCSMILIIGTFHEILWVSGCVYWITIRATTASTSFAHGWKQN